MMAARARISHKVELAAALLQIANDDEFYRHSKAMSPEQVISCFQRDHYPIRKNDGGPDIHWNITWRFIGAHREKTAKIDKPQMAKRDRIRAKEATRRPVVGVTDDCDVDRSEVEAISIGLPRLRPKSRIRSAGFDKTKTRTMSGKVVPRRQKGRR